MGYAIQVADATLSAEDLQAVVRNLEKQDYTLVSLAAGSVSGKPANILTLDRTITAATSSVVVVDGTLDRPQQRTALRDAVGTGVLVSYAGAWVAGELANVAVVRSA